MADSRKQESRLHVVVFPWLAFGHMIPFLELAEQLARRGHVVTFVSAPRNLARLRPVPAELSPRIRLVSLSLPAVDGLTKGAESTADVPPEKVELLKVAFDGLATPFSSFLAEACAGGDASPDWIVVDFAHHWVPPIADKHKVPCALFLIFPAAFLAFFGPKALNEAHPRTNAEDFTVPPPWMVSSTTSLIMIPVAFKRHEAEWIVQSVCQPNVSGASDADRFWVMMERCPFILSRSSRELDGAFCTLLGDLFGKPVVPAGLLAPHDAARKARDHHNHDDDDEETAISLVRWLDAQPARSVIYVAFGSEAPLTPEHVREIAMGLELAGVRFLWALRKTTNGGDLLPDDDGGFQQACESGRGVVRVGWVPQVRVLAHAAVGAFMTHAGLSSLMESFLFGHPIVMLPLFADQGITARLMTERRVGLEVPRGEIDGSVGRGDVAATVRRVMAEPEVFATNARALQKILWDTAKQDEYIDDLIEHLLQRPESCNV